jgi:exodeoxyribonuclease-3
MKIITWNLNGYRSVVRKDSLNPILDLNPDIICFQELKLNSEVKLDNYYGYFNFAIKNGYSGVAIYTKEKPLSVEYKLGIDRFDEEGRLIILQYKKFILINLYVPHGGRKKENLEYKLNIIDKFIKNIKKLKNKSIIICSDFNIAHTELDLARPKGNKNNIMFTKEERDSLTNLLDLKLIDSLRHITNEGGIYSWWPYAFKARERNVGWRIDYILVSKVLENKIKSIRYLKDYIGSDHCPVELTLENL